MVSKYIENIVAKEEISDSQPKKTPPGKEISRGREGISERKISRGREGAGGQKTASVPIMITRKMEGDLKKKGFSEEEINRMTPKKAWENLGKEF